MKREWFEKYYKCKYLGKCYCKDTFIFNGIEIKYSFVNKEKRNEYLNFLYGITSEKKIEFNYNLSEEKELIYSH